MKETRFPLFEWEFFIKVIFHDLGYVLMGMTRRCQIRRISCRNYLYYLTKWLSVVLKRSRSLIPWEPENRWKSIWQKKKFGNPFFNRFKNSLQNKNAKNFTNWAPSRTAGVKKSESRKYRRKIIPDQNRPRLVRSLQLGFFVSRGSSLSKLC